MDVNGDARITGTLIATDFKANQNISCQKVITGRILAPDSNGVHFGDSSLVIASPSPTANNIVTGATNVPYEKMYFNSTSGNLAIGYQNNVAVGMNSMAVGPSLARAYGKNSFALGMGGTETRANTSMAIGFSVRTNPTALNAIVLGCGIAANPLINSTPNSLAVGFNSTIPTLMVTGGSGPGTVGKVLIGLKKQDPSVSTSHSGALLQVNGDVVIGNTNTANCNLWVTASNWADFVFSNDYKLMPLSELEKFYKTFHHLPNVPSQQEVQEQGDNLVQTDVVLLQKIEENTLYIVDLKKQLDAQQNLIENQQKVITELAKKLEQQK